MDKNKCPKIVSNNSFLKDLLKPLKPKCEELLLYLVWHNLVYE
jgi:hypothetical protein